MIPTVADLRAACARLQITRYHLGALVDMHPNRLGGMLAGTIPMPPAVAARVHEALQAQEREQLAATG